MPCSRCSAAHCACQRPVVPEHTINSDRSRRRWCSCCCCSGFGPPNANVRCFPISRRHSATSRRRRRRSAVSRPCFQAFCLERSFPVAEVGPVACSHGRFRRAAARSRARASSDSVRRREGALGWAVGGIFTVSSSSFVRIPEFLVSSGGHACYSPSHLCEVRDTSGAVSEAI